MVSKEKELKNQGLRFRKRDFKINKINFVINKKVFIFGEIKINSMRTKQQRVAFIGRMTSSHGETIREVLVVSVVAIIVIAVAQHLFHINIVM